MVSWVEIREEARRYLDLHDEKRALKKVDIILDPDAPICVNCKACIHQGFLFICPIYQYPEDGKMVGNFGVVHYRRRKREGKEIIKITYPDASMKPDECESYSPMVPRGMLKKIIGRFMTY